MISTLLMSLAALPGAGDDNTLRAEMGGAAGPDYVFVSNYDTRSGPAKLHVVTNSLSNHRTEADLLYQLPTGEKGAVPKAVVVGRKVEPRSVTFVRTTYRPLKELTIGVAGSVGATMDNDFQFTANCWTESTKAVAAVPGARLEARLIAGDAKGKFRVHFACAVSGDKEKGYAYTYAVENQDAKEVSFRWAGLTGTLKPNETFTKTVPTARLTDERSETAVVDFAGGEATVYLKTNVWSKP